MGTGAWVTVSDLVPKDLQYLPPTSHWIGAILVTSAFPYMVELITAAGSFLVFAFFGVIGFLFLKIYIIELKGKNETDIALAYMDC